MGIFNRLLFTIIGAFCLYSSIHRIPLGHVGVYTRGGALLPGTTHPGYNLKLPFLTTHEKMEVRAQTDHLDFVPCGSSEGATVHLNIKVVNKLNPSCVHRTFEEYGQDYDKQLIYDFIPSEVVQFCKDYTQDEIYISKIDKLDELLLEKLRDYVRLNSMSECLNVMRVTIGRPELTQTMTGHYEAIGEEEKLRDLEERKKLTSKVRQEAENERARMKKARLHENQVSEMETRVMTAMKEAEIAVIVSGREAKQAETRAETNLLIANKAADADAYLAKKKADGIAHMIQHAFNGDISSFLEYHKTISYWNSTNKVYYFADSKDHLPRTFIGGTTGNAHAIPE